MTPCPPLSIDARWIFDLPQLTRVLESLAYPQANIAPLMDAAKALKTDREAKRTFLAFRDDWLSEKRTELDDPKLSIWHALAVISAYPATFRTHRKRGIPWEVTVATLEDLPRRMDDFGRTYGFPGFDAQRWMQSHVNGRIYQLGRLQFAPGKFHYSFNLYRVGSTTVPLARPGVHCSNDGWPQDDPTDGWTTQLTTRDGLLHGHTTGPTGAIQRETMAIPADSPLLLDAESEVLHTHIPMGKPLDTAACRASIAEAIPFFDRFFPERPWAAVCCGSWLLDRAMATFEHPPTNIVAFGELFRPLSYPNRNPDHYLRWIFGQNVTLEQARALPSPTRLQKGTLDYVASGGQPRAVGGYITRNEAAAFKAF